MVIVGLGQTVKGIWLDAAIWKRRSWDARCTRESPVETDGSDTSDSRLRWCQAKVTTINYFLTKSKFK
jgi:hypothetical protein